MTRRLRVATRGSTLARTQTGWVVARLGVEADVVVVETAGDRRTDAEIWQLGTRGVFVKEVEAAVLDGRADLAVHSAKDLPSELSDGLCIAAVPERADPRDALVGATLDALPTGARVGTGSVRRRAQLAWMRPDLGFGGLRGNIETRLAKAGAFSAIVVAAAALERLGLLAQAAELLHPSVMVPQVGQGALAVECRVDDDEVRERLAAVDHGPSRRTVTAERAFLVEVGGGCDLPVGAFATVNNVQATQAGDRGDGLCLTGLVATADGRIMLRHTAEWDDAAGEDDAAALGRAVGRHLLDEAGGRALLDHLAIPRQPPSEGVSARAHR